MTMPPRLCGFALTAHVTSWVGWLGAVAGGVPAAGNTPYGWRKQYQQRTVLVP
jgi:hypothetical protein